ncbi:MAG: hypothetical protein ACOC8F_02885 [Planctomycetota bacterium]
MTAPADNSPLRALRGAMRDRHFVAAAVLLGVCAGGWNVAQTQLQWVMMKEPVPWPAGVRVDEGFRLTTLAEVFRDADGEVRYRMITEDADNDGRTDGEVLIRDEEMDLLGIGHPKDRSRRPRRRSNWHVLRRYRDVETNQVWSLGVYYYTGMLDTVPHVPERCGQAAGMTPVERRSGTLTFQIPPAALDPEAPGVKWSGPIPVQRATFQDKHGRMIPEFYTFSLNGRAESSWEKVRLYLTAPWIKYCYFVKIQFRPLERAPFEELNRQAKHFAACALPEVFKALPTTEDVRRAEQAAEEN